MKNIRCKKCKEMSSRLTESELRNAKLESRIKQIDAAFRGVDCGDEYCDHSDCISARIIKKGSDLSPWIRTMLLEIHSLNKENTRLRAMIHAQPDDHEHSYECSWCGNPDFDSRLFELEQKVNRFVDSQESDIRRRQQSCLEDDDEKLLDLFGVHVNERENIRELVRIIRGRTTHDEVTK